MIETSEFRNGAKLELEQQPYTIISFEHHKPGKGNTFTRAKLRNLITGQQLERTFKSGEKFESPDIEAKEMQFLFAEATILTFMDTENYEQVTLNASVLKDSLPFLKDGTIVTVLFYNGKPITVELPIFVELPIEYCEPGFKGDTATGATKPATLQGGHKVTVPLHLKQGDILKIDTRTGEYIEKVNK
jgi:elongation factor P